MSKPKAFQRQQRSFGDAPPTTSSQDRNQHGVVCAKGSFLKPLSAHLVPRQLHLMSADTGLLGREQRLPLYLPQSLNARISSGPHEHLQVGEQRLTDKQMARESWFPSKAAQGFGHLGGKKESTKIKTLTGVEGLGNAIGSTQRVSESSVHSAPVPRRGRGRDWKWLSSASFARAVPAAGRVRAELVRASPGSRRG
ncbi:hypothetical protein E5288_WYG020532 [Bos mutus]|uniref:Uncharacterized protein n=1 Tax=Bos mutus TaxID=72004 RepID=A0A6B0RPH5_9CETA|nr:hypothetical protein [Bos mutus]